MTRSETAKRVAKSSLLYLGLGVAVVLAVPVLAGLAFGLRFLIPLLIVAALVGLAVSPALRRWFMGQADGSTHYHGLLLPTASLWLHPTHSWVRREGTAGAMVGADALLHSALGAGTTVDAPAVGTRVEQGERLFSIARGKRRLDIKAPVGGNIAEINAAVVADPTIAKGSPYGSGWVVRLDGLEESDWSRQRARLVGGSFVRQWFRSEVDRLALILSPASAGAMADGGVLVGDLSAHIDDAKWSELERDLFGQERG
jgi:glycine cleavage system H protein